MTQAQATYEALYTELKALQDADEVICSDFYARFCEAARIADDEFFAGRA